MADILTFDRFVPGSTIGSASEAVGEEALARWRKMYPWDQPVPGRLPIAICVPLMMRAYMKVVAPRPPGNIHARQEFTFVAPISEGENVTTEISCLNKELRRERRYLFLAVRSTGEGGRVLFTGRMDMIWAV